MVPALLTMKAAMDTILTQSFARNDSFAMALKEAFEHFINQRQNKCVLRRLGCLRYRMLDTLVQGHTCPHPAETATGIIRSRHQSVPSSNPGFTDFLQGT